MADPISPVLNQASGAQQPSGSRFAYEMNRNMDGLKGAFGSVADYGGRFMQEGKKFLETDFGNTVGKWLGGMFSFVLAMAGTKWAIDSFAPGMPGPLRALLSLGAGVAAPLAVTAGIGTMRKDPNWNPQTPQRAQGDSRLQPGGAATGDQTQRTVDPGATVP